MDAASLFSVNQAGALEDAQVFRDRRQGDIEWGGEAGDGRFSRERRDSIARLVGSESAEKWRRDRLARSWVGISSLVWGVEKPAPLVLPLP